MGSSAALGLLAGCSSVPAIAGAVGAEGITATISKAGRKSCGKVASGRRMANLGEDWPPPGRGLPIGAYTSQLFAAHVYLDGLDHFVKRQLKVPGYCRYVDDLFLFGSRRAELRAWRREIGAWLGEKRGLRLKHPNARILSGYGHLDALGYRITRDGWEALPRTLRRLRRRSAGELKPSRSGLKRPDLRRSITASVGTVLF